MKSKILFFILGVAACGSVPTVQAQQQAPVMTSPSVMPTYGISLFSHEFHVKQAGFGCVDCHNSIFRQAAGAAKATGDFNMIAFGKGKYCAVCHEGKTAFAVTDPGSCARCHGSDMKPPSTIVFEQPVKAVVFNHSKHVDEFGLQCDKCHENLFKMQKGESEKEPDFKMDSICKGKYCGACHDAGTRCTLCHVGVLEHKRLSGKKQQANSGR